MTAYPRFVRASSLLNKASSRLMQDDEILPEEPKPDKRMSCFLFVQLVVTILLLAGVIVTAVVNPPRKDKWLDLEIWKVSLARLRCFCTRRQTRASWISFAFQGVCDRNFAQNYDDCFQVVGN